MFLAKAAEADKKRDYIDRIDNIVAAICSGLVCNVG